MLKRNVERSVTLLSSSSSSSSFRKNEHTHAFVARLFFLIPISFFFVQKGVFFHHVLLLRWIEGANFQKKEERKEKLAVQK